MAIVYKKVDNKLEESESVTNKREYTLEQINNQLAQIVKQRENLDVQEALWNKRLTEAGKLKILTQEEINEAAREAALAAEIAAKQAELDAALAE